MLRIFIRCLSVISVLLAGFAYFPAKVIYAHDDPLTVNANFSDSTTPILIKVNFLDRKPPIPKNFLGLSFPTSSITERKNTYSPSDQHFFGVDPQNSNDQTLLRLLKNLGGGVLHFGQADGNYTYWLSSASSRLCPKNKEWQTILTQNHLTKLFRFATEAKWSIIFGLNLGCKNAAMAADEAVAFRKTDIAIDPAHNSLLALEIGNEPETFISLGLRSTYNPGFNMREFNEYATAINLRVRSLKLAGIPLAGPASITTSWLNTFVNGEYTNIKYATAHIYTPRASLGKYGFLNDCTGSANNSKCLSIITNLLSPATRKVIDDKITTLAGVINGVNAKYHKNISLSFDESNSIAEGGIKGVTDRYVTTLWGIDTLFSMAQNGAYGVNFTTGGCGGYTAIIFCTYGPVSYKANPLYYSMLFFRQATTGNNVQPLGVTTRIPTGDTANLSTYANISDGKILRIILVNRNYKASANVLLDVGTTYNLAGKIALLSAPTIDATRDQISFVGKRVNVDGSWSPNYCKYQFTYKSKGKYPLVIPKGSAMIVTFNPYVEEHPCD